MLDPILDRVPGAEELRAMCRSAARVNQLCELLGITEREATTLMHTPASAYQELLQGLGTDYVSVADEYLDYGDEPYIWEND